MIHSSLDVLQIKTLIKSKGLKINWLAHACGISPAHLYTVLSGKVQASSTLIKLLAIKLEVEESKLLKEQAS